MKQKNIFFLFFLSLFIIIAFLPNLFNEYIYKFYDELNDFFYFFPKIRKAFERDKIQSDYDVEENQKLLFYSKIYQKEYYDLLRVNSLNINYSIEKQFPIVLLVRSIGVGLEEKLLVHAVLDITLPQNGFLICPINSAIVGKIESANSKEAIIIPFWNENFSAQIKVITQKDKVTDLSFIENGKIINLNSFSFYSEGDDVFISEYEVGGYFLKRYNYDNLGKIGPLIDKDVIEYYKMEYIKKREEILKNRYFIIIS